MARVKIKSDNPKDPRRSTKLLEILASNDVYISRLIQLHDGFVALTASDEDLDKIFNNVIDKILEENNFSPQIPAQLNAQRSVLLFRVCNHIYSNTEADIKEEIELKNDWTGTISKVHKFPRNNIIKVTFTDTAKAKKAQESGIKLFHMKIAPYDIRQDEYINIMTCLHCYRMEDHTTIQCDKEKTYKICSECSALDHTWRDCTSETKKCISCEGPHSTLANRCPVRKEIINEKRKEKQAKENMTYSATLKSNSTQPVQLPNITANISTSTHTTIYQAMLHAHFINIAHPGSFSKTFNTLMKEHNLPTLKITEDPPSLEIIRKLSGEESLEKENEARMDTEEVQAEASKEIRVEEPKEPSQIEAQKKDSQRSTRSKLEKTTAPPTKVKAKGNLTAEKIGLTIITSESHGWRKGLTNKALAEDLKENKIKFTFTDEMFNEEEIIGLIQENRIELKDCFQTMDNTIFKKLRTGLTKELHPESNLERRRKITE